MFEVWLFQAENSAEVVFVHVLALSLEEGDGISRYGLFIATVGQSPSLFFNFL